jgi:hypothetical protein
MPLTPWEVASTMTRAVPFCCFSLLALAACNGPDPHPLAWSATYARPYEPLTRCLALHTPVDYQVMPSVDQRQKVGGVLLTSRSDNKKAGEFDVYAIDDTNSRVVFRSAIRTVGGSSYIEDQAKRVADSCGQ